MARKPVYLQPDQWALVDDLLAAAAEIIAVEAEARQQLMVQLQKPSRVGLRWCNGRISEIRQEIAKGMNATTGTAASTCAQSDKS